MRPVGQNTPSRQQGPPVPHHRMMMIPPGTQSTMLPTQPVYVNFNQQGGQMNGAMPGGQMAAPVQSLNYPGQPMWRPQMVPAGMVPVPGMMPAMMAGMPPVMVRGHLASGFPVAPPSYTSAMRQRFSEKEGQAPPTHVQQSQQWQQQQQQQPQQLQQMPELTKQQQQQLTKQRQHEEQKRKFKHFHVNGAGRSLDATSLIDSMITRPTPSQPVTTKPPPPNNTELPVEKADDNFGDFMAGPAQQVSTPTATGAELSPSPSQSTQSDVCENVADKEEKDNVLEMMLQCSDFSAPAKATSQFGKKPCMRQLPRPAGGGHAATAYHSSETARKWDADDGLTQLFMLPASEVVVPPAAPSGGRVRTSSSSEKEFVMPEWCCGKSDIPVVYTHVLEAVSRDDQIDTNLLYPILVRSGLSRETLGHIWALCNRITPGQLLKEELFLILAMVALAQNNQSVESLSILRRCHQAPVPYLGQPPAVAPGNDNGPAVTVQQAGTAVQPPGSTLGGTPACEASPSATASTASMLVTGTPACEASPAAVAASATDSDDEFNDWKSAPCASAVRPPSLAQAPVASADFSTVLPAPSPVESLPPPPCPVPATRLGPTASPTAAASSPSSPPTATGPQASTSPGVKSSELTSTAQSPGTTSLQQTATTQSPMSQVALSQHKTDDHGDFAAFPSVTSKKSANPVELMGAEDMYAALRSMTDDTVASSMSHTVSWGSTDDEKTDFANFNEAFDTASAGPADDSPSSNIVDSEPRVVGNLSSPEPVGGAPVDDFADFQSAGDSSAVGVAKDVAHDLRRLVMDDSLYSVKSQPEPVPAEPPGADELQDTWSDTWTERSADTEPATEPTSATRRKTANKTTDYFSRNSPAGATLGMAALDMLPPELPDDDDYGGGGGAFDPFGNFRGCEGASDGDAGFSSLGTPYGGLDIDDVPLGGGGQRYGQAATPDFGGWSKDDCHSVNSLDMKARQSGSSAADSQSEASMELAPTAGGGTTAARTEDGGADVMSVASLELKTVSSEVRLAAREDGDGTDEEAASPQAEDSLPKPRDVSDLLSESNMTNLTGDRYSQLSEEPQALDRHTLEWQRCLDKCDEIIRQANTTCSSLSSAALCQQLANSQQGSAYFQGVIEIYKVACRITVAIKEASLAKDYLEVRIKDIELSWMNLSAFISGLAIMPDSRSLDFTRWTVVDREVERACGVCLLDVDGRLADTHKLTYSGRQYHTACANFWLNCVHCTLPALATTPLL